ncbi:hypothetical protein GCM10010172_07050 [Paractinoplanes ferrugineus]|uniref:DNA helicase DnaB-like N-terminal domain-containing protein n=1 Tax=Paractinoplanes ferrugineus TaxID=113564 RepID=A0A919JAH7_9ACTN|nr:AAA family ATPase [Actinoplanes ferrugineus]GIE16267.1 hypothetical protein Afe05nite_81070 [Actinoplanes ferrugineus]
MTLPRQERRDKPKNGPPAAAGDPVVPSPAMLRIHEQTVLGWMLSAANHAEAAKHIGDIEIKHFYLQAHREIYAAIMVHAGAPNVSTLVAVDLAAENTHRSVRMLDGGVIGYLSECKEHADLLGVREFTYHVRMVREEYVRLRRLEVHARAGQALAAGDMDGYSAATDEMVGLLEDHPSAVDGEERFPEIDWDEAFAQDFTQMDWLPGRFLERGQQITLVGDGKVGKSLFVLDWVYRAVTGRAFIGDDRRPPITVLYFDRENSLRDVITRAQAFGASPDDLRGRVSYRQFPQFSGALDESERAAQECLGIVASVSPDVVVLDTASRFIGGKENESDTWLQLYQKIHGPLKSLGVACIRLDHFGKDTDRGSRGSSAKTQDVDHVWEMRRVDERKQVANGIERVVTTIRMHRTHSRTGLGDDEFVVVRCGEKYVGGMWLAGRTAHELADPLALERVQGEVDRIVDDLLSAGVPVGLGRDKLKAWMALKAMSTFSNDVMAAVVKELRVRQGSKP